MSVVMTGIRMPNREGIAAMTPRQHKSFETRLREAAKRRGLGLVKSRRHDPRALDYGGHWLLDGLGQRTRAIPGRVSFFSGG